MVSGLLYQTATKPLSSNLPVTFDIHRTTPRSNLHIPQVTVVGIATVVAFRRKTFVIGNKNEVQCSVHRDGRIGVGTMKGQLAAEEELGHSRCRLRIL
jgi:hypothetical protein